MAYTKQTWADLPSKTTPINANRLTHIEDGIFNAAQTADTAASTAGTAAANVGIVAGRVETLTGRVNGLDTAVSNKVDKVAGKGLSTNDFTDALKTKLDNIETGAEVNVQSDWNQSDNSADDYIKNKPTLGTASTKNSISVVTDSSDLVESGAVKDIVGWGNKNRLNYDAWKNNIGVTKATVVFENNGVTITATGDDGYTWGGVVDFSEEMRVPVKAGETVKFTWDCDETSDLGLVYIFPNGLNVGVQRVYNSVKEIEYTPIEGVTFITYRFGVDKNGDTIHYKNIMVSKDGGAYEPYHESVEKHIPQVVSDAVGWDGDNQLVYPYYNNSASGGINATVNNDGSITLSSGTASEREILYIRSKEEVFTPTKGKYTVKKGFVNNQIGIVIEGYNNSTWIKNIASLYSLTEQNIDIDYDGYDRIVIYVNIQVNAVSTGVTFKPTFYHITVDEQKADNSVIAPVEDGATASQAYSAGRGFMHNGEFRVAKSDGVASGATISDTNSEVKTIESMLIKKATFSGTTSASGNLSLEIDKPVLSVKINTNYAGGIVYYDNNGVAGIHVMNTDAQTIASTNISGTYYYIEL